MPPITDKQMRLIRFLIKELGWDNDRYHDFLLSFCKVTSTKELTIVQASAVISVLSNKPQMATPGQVRYIVDHWKLIDRDVMQYGDKHLHAFLERKFNVTSVYDLTKKQASGAIAAIRAMEKKSYTRAVEKAIAYEEQLQTPPMAAAYITLDGQAMVAVAGPNGKITNFRINVNDHGKLN